MNNTNNSTPQPLANTPINTPNAFVQVTKLDGEQSLPNNSISPQVNTNVRKNSDSDSDSDIPTDISDEDFSDNESKSSYSDVSGDPEDPEDPEETQDKLSNSDTASTVSTTEILGRDPLFLVLSEFLMDEEGNNIVHVLSSINKNLSKLVKALDKSGKKNASKSED